MTKQEAIVENRTAKWHKKWMAMVVKRRSEMLLWVALCCNQAADSTVCSGMQLP